MRLTLSIGGALLAATAFGGGPAFAANMCQAETLSCATTMPVGGYCECTSRGSTQSGTVVEHLSRRQAEPVNSTAGGCGAHPGAPGCR
jgi:hypothetical protein